MTKPEPRVLLTGAAGFVGRALCRRLLAEGISVIATGRHATHFQELAGSRFQQVAIGAITVFDDWDPLLQGVDVVVHLAARVHVINDEAENALEVYRRANVVPTERLARAAARAGVRRMVLLSSIKVHGERTGSASSFCAEDAPAPQGAYAVSKWEAEQALCQVAAETGLERVIVRSPLVYGPGVRANFLRKLQWVDRGLPLPFAGVRNQRSLIYLDNLADALAACAVHPNAAGNTYLVSDGEALSTAELIREVSVAMRKRTYLWYCPQSWLSAMARICGKTADAERLLGSLRVDDTKIRRELGWVPPYSLEQGLAETVRWFFDQKNL